LLMAANRTTHIYPVFIPIRYNIKEFVKDLKRL
jgi:hypothetical protein